MQGRYHVQRQHIINSLDTLLYQLHTLSFFLSPSIWSYVFRLACQSQLSKTREVADSGRSLRFVLCLVVVFNISSIWSHSKGSVVESGAMILDFIGVAHAPSRIQLLLLDIFIIILQMILASTAYESSFYHEDGQDNLVLPPIPDRTKHSTSPYVLDLRLTTLLAQLNTTQHTSQYQQFLPIPLNGTSWPLPSGIGNVIRAGATMRQITNVNRT